MIYLQIHGKLNFIVLDVIKNIYNKSHVVCEVYLQNIYQFTQD